MRLSDWAYGKFVNWWDDEVAQCKPANGTITDITLRNVTVRPDPGALAKRESIAYADTFAAGAVLGSANFPVKNLVLDGVKFEGFLDAHGMAGEERGNKPRWFLNEHVEVEERGGSEIVRSSKKQHRSRNIRSSKSSAQSAKAEVGMIYA